MAKVIFKVQFAWNENIFRRLILELELSMNEPHVLTLMFELEKWTKFF